MLLWNDTGNQMVPVIIHMAFRAESHQCPVMHPFFQGQHYVEAVKKCKFHFLRVLYAAHSSFMQQTPETIFHIRKASCSLMMSEDNPRCIPFAICSELSRSRRQNQTSSAKPDLL